jgi:hypothetical protein
VADEAFLRVPATLWAARLGGLVRARPFQSSMTRVTLPNEPDEKPELPMVEAFGIALLLWVVMAILFAWGLYWFW